MDGGGGQDGGAAQQTKCVQNSCSLRHTPIDRQDWRFAAGTRGTFVRGYGGRYNEISYRMTFLPVLTVLALLSLWAVVIEHR